MAAAVDLDPVIKQALNFLHSTSPRSAEEIRNCLDDIIKQKYGASKMIINTISEKHLAEEENAPGTISIQETIEISSPSPTKVISLSPSPSHNEMETVNLTDEVESFKEFGDLTCVVCREMRFSASNRLIECADCHSLYHQECHKPHISAEDAEEQEFSWCCANCKNKVMTAKPSSSPAIIATTSVKSFSSSHSSSSSTSSSPRTHHDHSSKSKPKPSSSKCSSSSSTRDESAKATTAATAATTTSPIKTPNINIISAHERHSSSRKHSHSKSKSSSSKDRDKRRKSSK